MSARTTMLVVERELREAARRKSIWALVGLIFLGSAAMVVVFTSLFAVGLVVVASLLWVRGTDARFRQRLRFVPLGQGRPVWVDDPQFDLVIARQTEELVRMPVLVVAAAKTVRTCYHGRGRSASPSAPAFRLLRPP